MNTLQLQLSAICQQVIATTTVKKEIEAAQEISAFFQQHFPIPVSNAIHPELQLTRGIALSTSQAADCLNDPIRTARFIKGVYQAIQVLQQQNQGKTIHILYAGCGPYAPLLCPVLTLLPDTPVSVLLIDIQATSVTHVQQTWEQLYLNHLLYRVEQRDASTYKLPEGWHMDLLITETMFTALTREPQVSISTNLAPQLAASGILIPQKISLGLYTSLFNQESLFPDSINTLIASTESQEKPNPVTEYLPVFCLDKFTRITNQQYISPALQLKSYKERPDICLCTQIQVFEDVFIQASESYITNPYCIGSLYNLPETAPLQLVYGFSSMPEWKLITQH